MTRAGVAFRAILLVFLAAPTTPARALARPPVLSSTACAAAIAAIEPGSGLPRGLLAAIAQVESGHRNTQGGGITGWPWTADIEGAGSFYGGEAEAVAAVRAAQHDGARSIDIGCMQVNLMHHPNAFGSLKQAFDPLSNVAYAARLLRGLYQQTGDWGRAAALYHSATPTLGAEYQRKVMAAWSGRATDLPATNVPPSAFRPSLAGAGTGASPFGTDAGLASVRGRPVERVAFGAGSVGTGRGLAAYRAMPIRMAGPMALRR